MLLQYNMNKINTKLYYAAHLGFSDTHTDRHPYPLSVSWPRRRTRCTSLWSTVPVKRLAWKGAFPVSTQCTWNAARHIAAHPSSTWASFPDPIGRSGYPSKRSISVLPLTLSDSLFTVWTQAEQRDLDLDPDQKSWCALQSRGLHRGRKEMKAQKHFEIQRYLSDLH